MRIFLISIVIMFPNVHAISLEESLVVPYTNILENNIASNQLQQQINISMTSIISNMATYDTYIRNLTDQVLEEYHDSIWQKVSNFKSNMNHVQSKSRALSGGNNLMLKCLIEDGNLVVLADQVNRQVKKCATVALSEMVNVVSDSINEAQTFMTIPQVIGKDVQRCGLSYNCRWDIVGDAISEAIQVPPKVFALAAKIQSIALRTVMSIDSCGLQGLREITETAMGILEDVFFCIGNGFNSSDSNPNASLAN